MTHLVMDVSLGVASRNWKCDGEYKQMVMAQRDASTMVVVQGTIVGVKGVSKVGGGQRQWQGQKNKRAWPPALLLPWAGSIRTEQVGSSWCYSLGPPKPRL